jgi:hypothetical protein
MKFRRLGYALNVGAVATLLAGCGGLRSGVPQTGLDESFTRLQTPISPSGQPPGKSVGFNATFSGTWSEIRACRGKRTNRDYTGDGNASFLGESQENGITSVSSCGHPLSRAGQFYLSSSKNQDSLTLEVTTKSRGFLQWYVKRGGGMFAKAKGLLKWTLTVKTHHRYTDTWTGKISVE